MITLNARMMQLIGPRDRKSDCVLRALTYITGRDYCDLEEMVKREQPMYGTSKQRGIFTDKLLRDKRTIGGYNFVKVSLNRDLSVEAFRMLYPVGVFFVRVQGHAFVIRDGQQFDACDTNPRKMVLDAWIAEKNVAVAFKGNMILV